MVPHTPSRRVEETPMSRLIALLLSVAATAAFASTASAQDADAGKRIFARCAVCHGIGDAKKPIAPSMNGVIGRTAGTEPDFLAKGGAGYSKAMIAAGDGGLVWDEANLDEYLTDGRKKIPGNKMAFGGIKAEKDRLDVIAYIKTFTN